MHSTIFVDKYAVLAEIGQHQYWDELHYNMLIIRKFRQSVTKQQPTNNNKNRGTKRKTSRAAHQQHSLPNESTVCLFTVYLLAHV